MGNKMIKLFFFFYAFIFFGCNTVESQNTDTIVIDDLKKEWKHSREEEIDSIQIYRPSDYKEFPISRYRQIYSFKDSGKCDYLVLAPNDAHYFEHGTWTYSEESRILIITDFSQQMIRKFKLIILTKELLKVVQL